MSLSGTVAVVTGGAQGLGKAFSEVLLRRGGKVCVADVKVQPGEATVAAFQERFGRDSAIFVPCDVTKESDIRDWIRLVLAYPLRKWVKDSRSNVKLYIHSHFATFEAVKAKYGQVNMMVNNAGIHNEDTWSSMIDINLKGIILGSMYGVEAMRKDKGGNGGLIVNVASTAGVTPVFTTPVYSASKYGVVGYTRSMADNHYLTSEGLKFACFCPAFTETEMINFKSNVKYMDENVKFMKIVGILKVSELMAGFEELLDLPDANGAVVTVTKNTGVNIKLPKNLSRL